MSWNFQQVTQTYVSFCATDNKQIRPLEVEFFTTSGVATRLEANQISLHQENILVYFWIAN